MCISQAQGSQSSWLCIWGNCWNNTWEIPTGCGIPLTVLLESVVTSGKSTPEEIKEALKVARLSKTGGPWVDSFVVPVSSYVSFLVIVSWFVHHDVYPDVSMFGEEVDNRRSLTKVEQFQLRWAQLREAECRGLFQNTKCDKRAQ